jgi:ribosomal-protein-alanine N-acetyltransferase
VSDSQREHLQFPVRAAAGSDIDAVAAIERSLFADPWSRRSFADLLSSPWVVFLVAAEESGTVAGYAGVLTAGDESELANLAVAREVQRAGVGRRLLAAGLGAARDRGCRQAWLEVRASNASAIALYESMRFRAVGRRNRYYAHPVEDAIVMRADLEESREGVAGRSAPGA